MMSERNTLLLSGLWVLSLVIHMTTGEDTTTEAAGATPATTTPPAPESNATSPGGGNETQPGESSTTPSSGPSGNNEGPDTSVDYCEPTLCPPGHHHVACNASTVSIIVIISDTITNDINSKCFLLLSVKYFINYIIYILKGKTVK